MTMHLFALLLGFGLDLLLGDPPWMPHPVRAMGSLITWVEYPLRRLLPKSRGGELWGGVLLTAIVLAVSTGFAVLLLGLCRIFSPWLAFAGETVLCYQLLATRSLRDESTKVYEILKTGDMVAARQAVAMIVGRDTDRLDEIGVAKATVETVAENASDGVIAPLLFMAIGGAPLGMLYKAVNTMDSMVGYQNDRYRYFGRFAARLDDVLNFIPARLAGILMCLAALPAGFDGGNAQRIFLRDRKNHKSPNSAHTEAACAGALNIQLGGGSCYGGQMVDKPTMGDPEHPVESLDILRANRLMYATAFLALVLFCGLPLMLTLAF